ncbi:MAG TPA: phosphoribosylformylglycinamidine synthase subunit PurL [Candidatus Bathyarchaeia archaeon]|nr:phosphoribosylformylglycinamidine synthase subunit PurL [Candidatus Bathyarchaeia archaeon]
MTRLSKEESKFLESKLNRVPNKLENGLVEAEWSEHCSYKSSKRFIKMFPKNGKHVVIGPGQDAGVLDIGNGYVVTIHIESHNHPSAVDPYGGAATGVGGVIRDILSMGTRPIALLDALRFAPPQTNDELSHRSNSEWLFRYAVKGIGDYGNCVGVPTIAGEIEFDPSFTNYCLIDTACIGFGRRESIVRNSANYDDLIILVGGQTGRDGIHGAAFASKTYLHHNRSAVQIPDPFLEKLLIEAITEAVEDGAIKALKDLGGGGLSCCLSELSDSLGRGFDIELRDLHVKETGMSPLELMLSESQERMLIVTDHLKFDNVRQIFDKYELKYVILGRVKNHRNLVIRSNKRIIADIPSSVIANAPLIKRSSKRPSYLTALKRGFKKPVTPSNLTEVLLSMLSNPSIASREWIYRQYDHEVGLRTVVKPGYADASVLRLKNGKFLSVKLDGNSKHCYIDPYEGTLGCLSEACRNVACTGAYPIGMIDHLQFGSPERPEVFWCFRRAVDAIINYCKFMNIPVVGGKVSFYNETSKGPIKPSPVLGAIGLVEEKRLITQSSFKDGDSIFIIGTTADEPGGSEYYEYVHHITGGKVPKVDLNIDKLNLESILLLIDKDVVSCAHDPSKGGVAVALSEMAILGGVGFEVFVDRIPNTCTSIDNLLFSESHSRYIIGTHEPKKVEKILSGIGGLVYSRIGEVYNQNVAFKMGGKILINTDTQSLAASFRKLDQIMTR